MKNRTKFIIVNIHFHVWNITKSTQFGALDWTLIVVIFVHRIKSFENSLSWTLCACEFLCACIRSEVFKLCYHHQPCEWMCVNKCACESASVSPCVWVCLWKSVCACKMCGIDFNFHTHTKKAAQNPYLNMINSNELWNLV